MKELIDNFDTEKLIHCRELIISESTIFIDDELMEIKHYRLLHEVLTTATENDLIRFVINTPGGYLDTFIQLYDLIQNCRANTIAEIYNAQSAGSLLALSCNEIEVKPFANVMIHDVSGGTVGKIGEMQSDMKFSVERRNKIYDYLYQGFLTDEEIIDLKKGVDFNFGEDEIKERLKNWTSIKKREQEK